MSRTIDERIVSMQFDNKQFESNVSTTMSTLDKFKEKLKFTDSTKGLDNIDKSVRGIDMSGLGSAVETVRGKFSALEVMGVTALANITNSAVNAGKRIVSALTIEPIKTGLNEYETQINAVQTILANTESKGTTLDDVNGALDELNTYADKTIYNFTEMTRNIGTFTAAGVDLDTSVKSIQGIANLAAVSGSSSQQASTAMYQLSQALSSGTVKLQDWNSVVNAGMGGQVFQDALKRTAKSMGVDVDAMIEEYGSFRETLSKEEWLTADILTKTLEQFTMAAEEGSAEWKKYKESLKEQGYTDAQAEEILKMANTATDAATKVKTFTQLWDTLKETAQSGWTQTWEILIGDFEGAKELFSGLYNTLSPLIEASAKARNELLKGWADGGGRQHIIDSLYNAFEGIGNIIKPIKEAFREIFPPTTSEQLLKITGGLKSLTEGFKNAFAAGSENADKLKRTFKGIFAAVDIVVEVFKAAFKAISPLFGGFDTLGGGILNTTANIGDLLVALRDSIETSGAFDKAVEKIHKGIEKVKNAFIKIKEFLTPVWEGIKEFGKSVSDTFSLVSVNAGIRLSPLKAIGETLGKVFSVLGKIMAKVAPWMRDAAMGIGGVFKSLIDAIGSAVKDADYDKLFDIFNGGVLSAIGLFMAKFMKSGSDIMDNASGFLENINGILEGVGDSLDAFTQQIKSKTLLTIASAIGILTASLVVLSMIDSKKLAVSLGAVAAMLTEMMTALAILGKISGGKGIKDAISMTLVAKTLTTLATALILMAVAMKIMSTMSWDEISRGLVGTVGGLIALVGAVNLLPQKRVNSAAKAISKMCVALVIYAAAMKIMATMTWEEIGKGLVATAVGMGILVAAVNLLPKGLKMQAVSLIVLAASLVILAGALKIFATMSWGDIGRGLTVLAGSLAAIVIAVKLLPTLTLPLIAAGLLIVAVAVTVLAGAMKIMATMSWEEIGKGLVVLAGSLLILAGAMHLMKSAIPGALAMLVIAPAVIILAGAMLMLGSMSWGEILRSLAVLAGTFVILGVAGLLLKPLIPTLLALSGSMLLFGIACAAIGVGAMAFGAGLAMIAASGAAAGVAIVAIVSGLIGLIPYAAEQIGLGLINLIQAIAGASAELCKAVAIIIVALVDALVASVPKIAHGALELVVGVLEALVKYTPTIVNLLFDFLIGVLDATAERLPDLIKSVVNLLESLFKGVIDALGEMDFETVVQGLGCIGLLSGMMLAFAAMALLVPAALIGVAGLGAVVAEMAIVLAAMGAFAQIPGLTWLIEQGGDLLQSIGTSLGKLIGGIVGGIAEGMTASLPAIGTSLSEFMTNATPFIEGAATLNPEMLTGVKALAETILILTAANVIDGLTSWFSGGSALDKFGEQLPALGTNLSSFATNLGTFDEAKVTSVKCAASAIKAIAEAAESLPNEGGWLSKIVGDNNIGTFAGYLPDLGTNLSSFATNLGTFDDAKVATVSCAAKAIELIADAADSLPNEGGWISKIVGDNNIGTFGGYLADLGTNLNAFATNLGTFEDGQVSTIDCAANAIKKMAEAANSLPNEGGWVAKLVGENSIGTFSEHLPPLGTNLKEFAENLGTFKEDKLATVNAAIKAVKAFTGLANVDLKAAKKQMDGFGEKMVDFGTHIASFAEGMNAVNISVLDLAATKVNKVIDILKTTAGIEGNAAENFKNSLKTLGESGVDSFATALTGSASEESLTSAGTKIIRYTQTGASDEMTDFKTALKDAVSGLSKVIKTQDNYDKFYNAGKYLVSGFAAGIDDNTYRAEAKAEAMAAAAAKAAKTELDINSPSRVGYEIGDFFGLGFINAIGDSARAAYNESANMASSAREGLSNAISKVADLINSDMDSQPVIRPVLDLDNVERGINAMGGMLAMNPSVGVMANVGTINTMMNRRSQNGANTDVVSAIDKLRKDVNSMERSSYNINGIAYDSGSDVAEAIETIVRAAVKERRT